MKMQCNLKRELCLLSKNRDDSNLIKIVTNPSVNHCQAIILKPTVPVIINYFVILRIKSEPLGKL